LIIISYFCKKHKQDTTMTTQETYLSKLRQFVAEHGAEYGISRIGIFGSVARGEHTAQSDVDVYYEGRALGLKSLTGLPRALEDYLGTPVDVVREHKGLDPAFRRRILNEVRYV
jgi:predicted nucleotidyltransferase